MRRPPTGTGVEGMHLARHPQISLTAGVRLLLLASFLSLIGPEPDLIVVGMPQTVLTRHPMMGVHTRLTDEVEEWKVQRSLRLVREMGAQWIVEFFPWAYYQGEDGGIAWSHPDMVVEHAVAQGLTVIARIGLTPAWARPENTPLTYLDENGYDAFASFAAAFAGRYKGKVDHIIVGNEPNLSFEWGYRDTTPADYVQLLEAVYPAVKAANADVVILGGALAPTLEAAGSPWGMNDLTYLEGIYESGGAPFFDALAVHSYGLTFRPEAEPEANVLNYRRVELLREIMVAHGDGDKPVYITEMGWNDHPRWTRGVSPGQRIAYTIQAVQYTEKHWDFVEMVAVWAFRYPAATKGYMDYYTLVTPEFVLKPIYDEIKSFNGNQ